MNNTPSLGVVGLGRMAQALLFPLLDAGLVEPIGVRAVVASEASAVRLAKAHGLAVATDPSEAWAAPVVLLAVKHQQLDQVAQAAVQPADSAPSVGQVKHNLNQRNIRPLLPPCL